MRQEDSVQVYFAPNIENRKVVNLASVVETFMDEEQRPLGRILADAALKVLPSMQFSREIALDCRSEMVSLPLRSFPSEADAQVRLDRAMARLAELRVTNALKTETRTAEVDWFGAQETLSLAQASKQGRVAQAAATCMPAEVQAMMIGPWNFIAWPGETGST